MPTLPDGTKISGAQQRKLKKLRDQAHAKLDTHVVNEDGERDEYGVEDFLALDKPDFNDPATALEFVRKAQLVAFYQICTARGLPIIERWKLIREMSGAMGLTHNRAEVESRTKGLEKALRDKKMAGSVTMVPGKAIAKPSTARGSRPPGPRSVPDDPSE